MTLGKVARKFHQSGKEVVVWCQFVCVCVCVVWCVVCGVCVCVCLCVWLSVLSEGQLVLSEATSGG